MSEGISVEYLDQVIRSRLQAVHVEIIDTSGKLFIFWLVFNFHRGTMSDTKQMQQAVVARPLRL